MRTGRLLTTVVIQVSLLLFCGCQGAHYRNVISAVPRDTAEALYVTEHAGLAEAAGRNHISIYWNGPRGGDDTQQQIVLAKRAVDEGDMGLVLSPNTPFALNTVIQRALAHGVPVVVLGSAISLPPSANLSLVINDEQQSGRLAAERIQALLHGEGEIAMAGVDPMSPGTTDRANAFERWISQIAPHVHIVSKLVGTFTFGQAEMAVEEVIEAHPHLAAVYALNVPATRGAVAALRTSRREASIRIIGSDQTLDLLFLLREGAIDSLVIQDMRGMGAQAVENIVAAREHRKVAAVTRYEPVLLRRANIDSEPIQQMLKMDWRPRE